MKKRIIAILTAFSLLLTLTGCSGNKERETETETGSGSDIAAGSEQNGISSEEDPTAPQKTAMEIADVVLSSVEFPQTVNVTDEEQIGDMGIDLSGAEDYAVVQQMLSVDVVEVIILKVRDGGIEQALDSLEKRKESLINDFAFYPGQVESAEATVVGSKGNTAYLICHKDAAEAEEKLLEAID